MTERPGEMDERDVDARFASIVAAWDGGSPTTALGGEQPPDAEPRPGSDPDGEAAAEPAGTEAAPFVVVPGSSWRTPSTGQDAAEHDTDDDHFEPPPVALPPQEDLHFWSALVGLVLGPALLLYVAIGRPGHSARWFAAAVLLTLVGFGLLLLRQPRERDPADPDDGARV
ncbi:MAG: hypothetical protein ACRCXL_11350 [Dermatophilaceae bacterium]